jgi:hypothetical protein
VRHAELFPTPPFPDATAIVFLTPGSTSDDAAPKSRPRVFAVIVTSTSLTPSRARTRSRAARSNSALTGQAGVVSSIEKETFPLSIRSCLMKPSSTMFLLKSGSMIGRSAPRTSLSLA